MATPKRPDHNAEPLTWDHDTNDPKAVTLELTKPFPKEALEAKEGFTYVKYPDMIRRLIRATGNRFSIRLVGQESTDFGMTNPSGNKKPQQKLLLRAWVELDIPVLGSARTHEGVQIAYVGTGEDIYKGAVSDAIKKAAQSYGVGIELTGADAEWYIAQREHQPQQPAPPEPTPIRTPPPVATTSEPVTRTGRGEGANKALHAKVDHDQLHAWAVYREYESLSHVPDDLLVELNSRLGRDKDKAEFIKAFPPKEAANG